MTTSLAQAIPSWGSPTLEDFDMKNLAEGQRISGSGRQFVRFYKKKIAQPTAKEVKVDALTGIVRPVSFEVKEIEREMVEIITPGDKNRVDDFAQDWHKRSFWRHYTAFRDGKVAPQGQSIDECDFIPSATATELKYLGCHTVEQFAAASDYLCDQIANGWELREYARAVTKANGSKGDDAQVGVLRAELESSKALIADMQEQMNQMKGLLLNSKGEAFIPSEVNERGETQAPQKIERRGRPRKDINQTL